MRFLNLFVQITTLTVISSFNNFAEAAAFGHPNGTGGTVYSFGADLINSSDDNDYLNLYSPEHSNACVSYSQNCKLVNNKPSFIETRKYYDVKSKKWLHTKFYIFKARYKAGKPIEIQVSYDGGERNWKDAYLVAKKYGYLLGFIPPDLRKATTSLTIHNIYNGLMGGNNNIIIFEKRGEEHIKRGSIEEALFHEATHNHFNKLIHDKNSNYYINWVKAKNNDNNFISYYAKNNNYEDVAESFIAFYALKYKLDRIPSFQKKILTAIPNRIKYFERLNLNLTHHPITFKADKEYQLINVESLQSEQDSFNLISNSSLNLFNLENSAKKLNGWKLITINSDFDVSTRYRFKNSAIDNKCLDITNGGNYDQFLKLSPCGNYSGQSFSINPVGNGQFKLIPLWQKNLTARKNPYLSCLTLANDKNSKPNTSNSLIFTTFKLSKCDSSDNQIFTFIPLDS